MTDIFIYSWVAIKECGMTDIFIIYSWVAIKECGMTDIEMMGLLATVVNHIQQQQQQQKAAGQQIHFIHTDYPPFFHTH